MLIKNCNRCTKEFEDTDDTNYHKGRGICHYTSKYRVAAHGLCNLR